MILKDITEFITSITDEIIALGVIGSTIGFVYMSIAIPEVLIMATGMVMVYYFQKKGNSE